MTMFRLLCLVAICSAATAYTSPRVSKPSIKSSSAKQNCFLAAASSAALALVLSSPLPAAAMSNTAAQIDLNALPPTTVKIDINDLPVIGGLISGTYTKVPDGSVKSPSVTIKSPKDKVSAIKSVATDGHLEFDVNGILGTHLDIDIAAEKSGVATVRVASNLIPKLPFKNLASSTPKGAKRSDWSSVMNLGNGESYYFNEKTGETKFERPEGF